MKKLEVNGTQRWTAKRRFALVLRICIGQQFLGH